jgi:hypothetical protein
MSEDKEVLLAILLEKLGDLAQFSAKNPSLARPVNEYRDKVLAIYQGVLAAPPEA